MAASAQIFSFYGHGSWETLMELEPGKKVQVVDRLKIEFYEAPFLDSVKKDIKGIDCGNISYLYINEEIESAKYCILLRGNAPDNDETERVCAIALANNMPTDRDGLYYQLSCGNNISSQDYQKTESLIKMGWDADKMIEWTIASKGTFKDTREFEKKYKQRSFWDEGPNDKLQLGFGTILRAILINYALTKGGYKHVYNEAANISLARSYYARFEYILYDTNLCNTTHDAMSKLHLKAMEEEGSQAIDKKKLELYRECWNEDPKTRTDPGSANTRFKKEYGEYFFESDICQEIDKKLETLKTANGSYKMKLCNLPTKLIDYCEKKFNNAKILLKKYIDWSPPTN
mgnify:CR=1 FL=1